MLYVILIVFVLTYHIDYRWTRMKISHIAARPKNIY